MQGNGTRHHRRLQQAAVPTELGEKEQALEKLTPGCRSLVLLAEPGDAYGAYQSLLSAGTVVGNMRKIEANFGLKVGSYPSQHISLSVFICLPADLS